MAESSKAKINVLAPRSAPSNEVVVQALFEWMNAQWTESIFGAGRELDTTYQNDLQYPLDVSVTATTTGTGVNGDLQLEVNGGRIARSIAFAQSSQADMAVFTSVPPGASYRVSTVSGALTIIWKERSVV